jgi:DEAD/DEAH box helicase domain-containing protein
LVEVLQTADLVIGFNVHRFDYTVLQPYTHVELRRLPTVDMLTHIHGKLGFRVSLDALVGATLGLGKSADGLQAVRWYKQGRLDKVMDYCQRDVELTRDLYEFGQRHGHVRFRDRRGSLRQVSVNWP